MGLFLGYLLRMLRIQIFKVAADRAAWKQQCRTVEHFKHLRKRSPGAADKLFSFIFKSSDAFSIALVDSSTGEALSGAETVDTIVDDLMARAHNDFPHDPSFTRGLDSMVAEIARSGGIAAGSDAGARFVNFYSDDELDGILAKFCKSKKCTKGCYAALCAPRRAGRHLTLALADLGLFMVLTSSLWSLRRFTPIKKLGPSLVRSVECL